MDIQRTPNSRNLARLRYEETRREVAEESQDRVREARQELARLSQVRAQRLEAAREGLAQARADAALRRAADQDDQVQISEAGRALASSGPAPAAEGDDRAARIAELKAQFEAGELVTNERVDRAAENLLSRGDAAE